MSNYIVSLTTIPSKFESIYLSIDSILNQTILPEKIFLHIPKVYNFRFENQVIPLEKINKFKEKYPSIIVNIIDKDYGPGTKLLGLFCNNIIENIKSDTYIVLVDDDLTYKPFLIEGFNKLNESNNIEVASYYSYTYNKITIGQGADGFFIKKNTLDSYLKYYDIIKDQNYIFYHDDFYLSFYFHLLEKKIIRIKINSTIYNSNIITHLDALHNLKGEYGSKNLHLKSYQILTNLNIKLI
jgi:hypothetical protein